jgi:hypothetical protein
MFIESENKTEQNKEEEEDGEVCIDILLKKI